MNMQSQAANEMAHVGGTAIPVGRASHESESSMDDYIEFIKQKSELKTAYFDQAVKNIESASATQGGLFEACEVTA